MPFEFRVPTSTGAMPFGVEAGTSIIFVGANGGGKTRLAAQIEVQLGLDAHRISAHRALTLNPDVPKISEERALRGLRFGANGDNISLIHREGQRWGNKNAVSLLNDFDYVLQVLFAEQSNTSLATHLSVRAGAASANATKFEILEEIWQRLLPHRRLYITGDDILVSANDSSEQYKASEMSDGERAIFYLIGQTLVAQTNSLLIFDEPELHVHRSIMSKLWDELEAARPDCAFVFITHDLEFAAARVAQKFFLRSYRNQIWDIEKVPENTGFSEEMTTLILGSRKPILFVEGDETSLDFAIYRCCFPEWTVLPRGSCEVVMHSVVSMRSNAELTRVTCAGIVDADDYTSDEIANLNKMGVAVLPVSEIENLILLPDVSRRIAEAEGYAGAVLQEKLDALKAAIFDTLNNPQAIDAVVMRYCRRRIDRILKKIDLYDAQNVAQLETDYSCKTGALNISQIAEQANIKLVNAIEQQDLATLLSIYDNKGLFALAANHLKNTNLKAFQSWLTRVLRTDKQAALVTIIREQLPIVTAR